MHGCVTGFTALLDAEVDSMGGVFDGGISIDTRNSPRQAAIEKAQAELRLEYDIREERRRELEFLERGGNPLDFRFFPPASASVQSTSLADHLLENEAKGSFAVATSPQGDSVESSGRPGTHFAREPNIADNLLLLDGIHRSFNDERNGARSKRKKVAAFEPRAKPDGSYSTKESEESSILRLSAKGQAYARRNRSRTSRDNAHASIADLATSPNRNLALSSSQLHTRRSNIPLIDVQPDGHDTSVCKPKPTASFENNNISKTFLLENLAASDVEGVTALQPHELHTDIVEAPENRSRASISDNVQECDDRDQISPAVAEQDLCASISASSNLLAKRNLIGESLDARRHKDNISKSGAINGYETSRKKIGFLSENQSNGKCPSHPQNDILTRGGATFQSLTKELAGSNNGLMKQNKISCDDDTVPGTVTTLENEKLTAVDLHLDEKGESCYVPLHVSNVHAQRSPGGKSEHPNDGADKNGAVKSEILTDSKHVDREPMSRPEKRLDSSSSHTSDVYEKACTDQAERAEKVISFTRESSDASVLKRSPATSHELLAGIGNNPKARKSCEDAIMKEARAIEVRCRRANEPPVYNSLFEKHIKTHWDYVLEEMAWLANDFMQERLWKISLAAHICKRIAISGSSLLAIENLCRMQRRAARALAESVLDFWNLAEKNKGVSDDDLVQYAPLPIQRYAVRRLQSEGSHPFPAEAPRTPDRIVDGGIFEISWEEKISDESMFYKAPFASMQAFRESMEAYWLQHENMDANMQQVDCEVSVGDSATGNAYEDDEDETAVYYLPNCLESNRLLNFSPKKIKGSQKKSGIYGPQGTCLDSPYASGFENRIGNPPSLIKRPSTLNVGSIPTKRVRTATAATRQRVGPFGGNATGVLHVTSKTDVSSGDTNSFQDDEGSLQGFPQKKNADMESTVDFDKQLSFDGTALPTKSRKKKPKYFGYRASINSTDCGGFSSLGKGSYDRKWPLDSLSQHEQADLPKRRLDGHHFEPNGPAGIYPQHAQKKPKVLKLPEASHEAVTPVARPLQSPVASQMSNMPNSNRLIKVIQSRDKGKKNKTNKGATGQPGSGSSWSEFEDQALVVLVHDMGPNWELVSDAINSTLQFKCIFRKPKECKERHKVLMDKNGGDGADSAADSGSSQHYPSTLPGIPKGSARQLLQHLQGPVEEDTIKAHFEKIIAIGQKLHTRRIQRDNQELKQTNPVHSSHFQALSQACPSNLSGGPLTPLDLCDAITPNPEVLGPGYQGSHSSGVGLPSPQASLTPTLPASSANTMLQNPGMVMGNSFPPNSGTSNAPIRDTARYGMSRSTSLPVDDQQRLQYNPMHPNRTVTGTFSVGADRGVRMLSGGSGVGMMCGMNLGLPTPRPGFQGIGSPGVLNMVPSNSMLPANGVGILNIPHGAIAAQGNSTVRSRESLQPRPGPNMDDTRQAMMQEFQVQVAQGNDQSIPPFNPMTTPFSNQTIPSPLVQTFPVQQQQQSHQISQSAQQPHLHANPHHPHIHGSNYAGQQQQAYAMRLAKERQQRLLQQQQQQQQQQPFSGSSAVSPLQSSTQLQQPTQPSSPLPPISPSHSQQKQPSATQNPQTGAAVSNQVMKHRQRQQLQQHQARQQTQQQQPAQQQAKLVKGVGRGGALTHQNVPVDASYMNGPSMGPGSQILEKHMMQQRQAFYSGTSGISGSNPTLPQNSQQRMYPRAHPQSSKVSSRTSQTDGPNQGPAQVSTDQSSVVPQPPTASSLPLSSQHQQQRQPNQTHQTMHRVILQQNRQLNTDNSMHSSIDPSQSNQIRSAAMPQSLDSANAVPEVTSGSLPSSHWKPDRSFEASAPAVSNSQMASSPQSNLVGGIEPHMSSGPVLMQRQFSGSFPVHGQGNGGPWQQQQQQQVQSQQPPTSTSLSHQQHRQPSQGQLYGRPSPNPGPG